MIKVLQAISTILFVLALPMLLVTTDLRVAVNEISLYEYGFNKYEVSADTGLEKHELREVARELIDYFNSDEEFVETSLFRQREIEHLKDVQSLIHLDYRLQLASFAYIVTYIVIGFVLLRRAFWRDLAQRLVWGSGVTIALIAALGIGALIGFDTVFRWFHLASFSNDLWQLSPDDYLIRLFPQEFFRDATLFIAGAIILEALVIGGVSWGLLRLKSRAGQQA
ncbi:TIGR01906 family membrane protein [Chloroflexota bacterium]